MSDSSAEKIWNHVKTLPAPLQSVLQRKLSSDELSTPVREIAKRFNLSEEESNLFETEATLLVVGLSPLETFKDDLIAEVGLSYETAVRIQRAFEKEVMQPIRAEAQAIESSQKLPPPIPSSSPPPIPPPALAPSRADHLYQDEFLRITPTTIVRGATTYPTSKVASVMAPLRLSAFDEMGGCLINLALLVGGLVAIFSFKSGWMIAGLIAAAIGGFNVWGCFNNEWWITVKLVNGEEFRIERRKKSDIDAIHSALAQVISQ